MFYLAEYEGDVYKVGLSRFDGFCCLTYFLLVCFTLVKEGKCCGSRVVFFFPVYTRLVGYGDVV